MIDIVVDFPGMHVFENNVVILQYVECRMMCSCLPMIPIWARGSTERAVGTFDCNVVNFRPAPFPPPNTRHSSKKK